MLTSKQRAALRGAANGLAPVFQIGKAGVEPTVVSATVDCLKKRELVKLRLLETCPATAREAAEVLAEATGGEVVHVIGRTVVLFLKKKKDSAYEKLLK
ncbi:MAG: YhbY family RNA-binding protein [Oscillospiraceae bacterium]